jgi:hypothetical protein
MTDFATESDVIAGMAGCSAAGFSQEIVKNSITTVAAFEYSGWTMGGNPIAGVAPTAWAHPNQTTVGALTPRYINGGATTTCRILFVDLRPSIANTPYIIRDRVGHMAGLSGTSVAAQTVNATLTTPAADGRCEASGGDVEWWLEWYTTTGTTGINMTVAVTYNDDTTGNVVIAIPASCPAYRRYRIPPSSANRSIKSIQTVTNSATTGTAGSYGVTATQRKFSFSCLAANIPFIGDWASLGMPVMGRNACLEIGSLTVTGTAFGTIAGKICAGVR